MSDPIFYKPYLKKRVDDSVPKKNPYFGELDNCFDDFETDTFHFFTEPDETGVKECIWKTLLLKENDYSSFTYENFINYIGKEKLINEIKRSEEYKFKLQYIIFYDVVKWLNSDQQILIVTCSYIDKKIVLDKKMISLREFERFLFKTQGCAMVMNKPLIYSQTELEGYLADMCQSGLNPVDRAIFPGDVDCLIYENNKVKYMLEFKKHTLKSPIEQESFLRYWSFDKKKYKGLSLLAKRLRLDYFYNVIYSTKVDTNKIKIQKITSWNHHLVDEKVYSFSSKQELETILSSVFRIEETR